jgi:mRNA interferase RelE/StbE
LVWRIEFDSSASKDLQRLDRQVARRITTFLRERVASLSDPRSIGQALKGERFGEFWKYRIGDYRIIARIEDRKLVILVVRVGHRSRVYDQ